MKSSGFNLVELSIVLLILAIGLTIALPTLHDRMKRDISRATRDSLTSHLMAARASSIQNGVIIEVCGSGVGSTCSEEWHLGCLMAPALQVTGVSSNVRTIASSGNWCSIGKAASGWRERAKIKSSLTCAPGGERTVSHTVCQSSHSPLRLSLLQGQCALH